MSYDKKAYTDFLQQRELKDQSHNPTAFDRSRPAKPSVDNVSELLRQAAVKSELLTGDDCWDTYMTRLQKEVEKCEQLLRQARAKLEQGDIWDAVELHRIKSVVIESKAMIAAFSIAMHYPKAIIDQHKSNSHSTNHVK